MKNEYAQRFSTAIVFCSIMILGLSAAFESPAGNTESEATKESPIRIVIAGLVHDHVHGVLRRWNRLPGIEIVGIAEPDEKLVARYREQYDLPAALFYSDLKDMLERARPRAVAAFTSTFDHESVVETCAPRGVHVMMEKPLAVSMEHARAMQRAAKAGNIYVLVNYETTWYPSNHAAHRLVQDGAVGDLRKIVVRDGHRGPREIGCSEDFLAWLTDPVLNGGGALMDFGCYGANLITWLMNNQRPLSVTAVTQTIKPDVYPKVDDEATIVLEYPKAQGIIQASWNWPINRKDMDIYGRTGYVLVPSRNALVVRREGGNDSAIEPKPLKPPSDDFFSYLAAVVRGEIEPGGLSSLVNNMIVTEILSAARRSAETGTTVKLPRDDRQ